MEVARTNLPVNIKKDDNRDYLVKITSSYDQTQKFRSHQEVLASRLALACGAAVPTIYEIQDSSDPQKVYVASDVIQHSTDFTADQIQKLQGPNKQNILSDCVIHAWLCNRDLVNTACIPNNRKGQGRSNFC